MVFAIWRNGLNILADLLGIVYTPLAFILILVMAIFLILIQFSVVISDLSEKNKKIAQELGILKMELANKHKKEGEEIEKLE